VAIKLAGGSIEGKKKEERKTSREERSKERKEK